jgi:tetratricopeptide (TPR) repeat protein
MTLPRLAIPAVSFILLSVFIPSRAQNTPDPPSAQLASSSVGTQPPPALSDEDMARLLLVRKQYTEAEAIFRRLTVEQPKNAVYWNELGISRHSQSQLGAALKCYEKSAVDFTTRILSTMRERSGTNENNFKAIRAYRKAIKLRDDFAPF